MAIAPNRGAVMLFRPPLKPPIGVRAAPRMTTSFRFAVDEYNRLLHWKTYINKVYPQFYFRTVATIERNEKDSEIDLLYCLRTPYR
jgi:hypothetical protein